MRECGYRLRCGGKPAGHQPAALLGCHLLRARQWHRGVFIKIKRIEPSFEIFEFNAEPGIDRCLRPRHYLSLTGNPREAGRFGFANRKPRLGGDALNTVHATRIH